MCKRGTTTKVRVKIPADLSSTGKRKWEFCEVDSCIAPLVKALQKAGIGTIGSCCGHGEWEGYILLEDERRLLILDEKTNKAYEKHHRMRGTSIKTFLHCGIR